MPNTIGEMEQKLREAAEEAAQLEKREAELYERLGRDAFDFLRGNPEFAEKTGRIADAQKTCAALQKTIAEYEEELTREKRAEKKRLALHTCFSCGTVNPEGALFCEECGGKVGEKPRCFCETCGTLNAPEQWFCGECGEKLPL